MKIFQDIKIYLKTFFLIIWMWLIYFLSSQQGSAFSIEIGVKEEFAAHVFLYAVLAFLAKLLFKELFETKRRNLILITFGFVVLHSVLDEYHQSFIPGRDSSFHDILYNIIGFGLGILLYFVYRYFRKPKILLHVCCIGCGAFVASELKKDYRVELFFYNPNIYPKEEYAKRLAETAKAAKKLGLKLHIGEYAHKAWLGCVEGLEKEPEKGARCDVCYEERLEETFKKALLLFVPNVATTLTVSPHKSAEKIMALGGKLEEKYKINFLARDFKKNDGFKKASELSKKLNLYRQEYCGCEFSIRK